MPKFTIEKEIAGLEEMPPSALQSVKNLPIGWRAVVAVTMTARLHRDLQKVWDILEALEKVGFVERNGEVWKATNKGVKQLQH